MNYKYYVWYDYGDCTAGNHDTSMQEFATLEEANHWVENYRDGALMDKTITGEGQYSIIFGTEIE